MRGEQVEQAFVGFAGVYGDRLYAFHDTGAPKGLPYLTGREQERTPATPRFRNPQQSVLPPNLSEAEGLAPGLTPKYGSVGDMMVEVETPSSRVLHDR